MSVAPESGHGPASFELAGRPWVAGIERTVGGVVDAVAAVLVLVEIGVLFSSVVSRYLLHDPLVWADELASILFLWLAMLGAAIALRRGEHMRMTALVSKAGEQWRGTLELIATAACLAFLAMVTCP